VVLLLLSAGLLLAGAGCMSKRVRLAYKPITPQGAPRGKKIVVVKVKDERGSQELGARKNILAQDSAAVKSLTDVPELVTNAFMQELTRAGYQVERLEASPADPTGIPLLVTGNLKQALIMTADSTVSGSIAVELVVLKDGLLAVRKKIIGNACEFSLVISKGEVRRTLNESLQKVMSRALREIEREAR